LSVRLLAEFAIVVLGVTIDLWADSWVADRGNQEEEISRLLALKDNIEVTLTDIQEERESNSGEGEALRQLCRFRTCPRRNR